MNDSPVYEVYAVKYAERHALRADHFLDKEDVPDPGAPMPMDYFIWVVRNNERTIVVDTGFSAPVAAKRGRYHLRQPIDALRLLEIAASDVDDLVITHMHYDHAGTLSDFTETDVHLQDRELHWVAGKEMFDRGASGSFELPDIVAAIEGLYGGRVALHEGDWDLAPGITVHLVPGHTPGIQVLRVPTARGAVVLASDTTHYYENMETRRPFATTYDRDLTLAGYDALQRLADTPQHIVPGHDPLVMQRYPAATPSLAGIVARLDASPSY